MFYSFFCNVCKFSFRWHALDSYWVENWISTYIFLHWFEVFVRLTSSLCVNRRKLSPELMFSAFYTEVPPVDILILHTVLWKWILTSLFPTLWMPASALSEPYSGLMDFILCFASIVVPVYNVLHVLFNVSKIASVYTRWRSLYNLLYQCSFYRPYRQPVLLHHQKVSRL